MVCGLLQGVGHHLVRRPDRGGELPRSCLRIVEEFGESGVNPAPAVSIGRLVRSRSQERVREPDAVLFEFHDPRFERRAEACLTIDFRGGFRDGDRWMCMRCCREQKVTALLRQSRQPPMDETVQRLGNVQRLAAIDGDAATLQRANDLQGIERVATGHVPHLVENRPRQDQSQMRLHDVVQSSGVEWANLEGFHAVGGQRASKLLHQEAVESRTTREEQPDALGPKPPAGERKATSRGWVEPLDVVDRNDDGPLVGERAQRVQEREAYRVRIRRRPLVVAEDERAARVLFSGPQGEPRAPRRARCPRDRRCPRTRALSRSRPGAPRGCGTHGRPPHRDRPAREWSFRSRHRLRARAPEHSRRCWTRNRVRTRARFPVPRRRWT